MDGRTTYDSNTALSTKCESRGKNCQKASLEQKIKELKKVNIKTDWRRVPSPRKLPINSYGELCKGFV